MPLEIVFLSQNWDFSPTCPATCLHVYLAQPPVTRTLHPSLYFSLCQVSSPTLLTYFSPRFSGSPLNSVLFSSHRPIESSASFPGRPESVFHVFPVIVNKHHSLQFPGICVLLPGFYSTLSAYRAGHQHWDSNRMLVK